MTHTQLNRTLIVCLLCAVLFGLVLVMQAWGETLQNPTVWICDAEKAAPTEMCYDTNTNQFMQQVEWDLTHGRIVTGSDDPSGGNMLTLGQGIVISSCESQMREAMQAMDEFVPTRSLPPPIFSNSLGVLSCQSDACVKQDILDTAKEQYELAQRREAAIDQWRAAKACWQEGK